MSLLLLFGSSSVIVSGSVVNITLGAPTGSIGTNVVVSGSVVNISLGAPTGDVATPGVVQGVVVNITLAAPVGSVFISAKQLRDPLSAWLAVSQPNSVTVIGASSVRISPTTNIEVH